MFWQPTPGVFDRQPAQDFTGELELGIALSGGKSIATRQFHTRALKVVRPHYLDDSGQVYYIIANPGGGYVGGDSYRIKVDVDPGASILLTDQSAAKVYRTPGDHVVQGIDFTVATNAVLEYIPDQLILYRDADFRQQINVDIARGGSLFMSDVVTPGWSPDGAEFRYRQAHLRNVISYDGKIALVDNIRIEPLQEEFSSEQNFYLGEHTHFATAICIDEGVDDDLLAQVKALVAQAAEGSAKVEAAVSATEVPGFVLRAVGTRTEELLNLIIQVASLVRGELRGQEPVTLRQY